MGQTKSSCLDFCGKDRSLIQAILLPKRAPEWYRKMVMGATGEIHTMPAPEGSLMLLGHIALDVPDLEPARIYYFDGLECGESQTQINGEVRANLGPSQLRFAKGSDTPQAWPGEIHLWVEDIRQTTDMFNMLGRTLGTDLVGEFQHSEAGGEFQLKLHCPFRTNWIVVSEAPEGWAPKLRKLGHDPSLHETEYPPKTKNAVAVSDATIYLTKREQVASTKRFYEHFLSAAVTAKFQVYNAQAVMDMCQVHFGIPCETLHQTLTFQADKDYRMPSAVGSVCIYLRSRPKFRLAFSKFKHSGLLSSCCASKEWKDIEAACEFRVTGIVDPENNSSVLRIEHVIRYSSHPECPVHPEPER
eukprot:TRINITY_DN16916_c0_g1_i2.p1 TRINITY_DN16916_c0_g1~~TRINITY_DN16916_c0_g1_i2.p1  ORF type:complete len:358 (+),score=43.32 TRINITY_DN16916_c0_g1_i2:70-1143(+)